MGIMMLAIKDVTKDEADKAIVIAGPICLTVGIIFITLGFVHQYWVHKKWKAKEYVRTQARKERAKKYAAVNGEVHQTIDGIVLDPNCLEQEMKVDMNGFAITEENQHDIFRTEPTEEAYHSMTHAIIYNEQNTLSTDDEPQAGTSGGEGTSYTPDYTHTSVTMETGDEIVPIPDTATYEYLRASQHFYCVDDDDDDDDLDDDELRERYAAARAADNYGFEHDEFPDGYDNTDYSENPYSLDYAQDTQYSTEYSGPSLEYEPPKSYTDPGIFCVSNSDLQIPTQDTLQSETSGKTPRYSRYSSKAILKQLLPSLKLPNLLRSPRGSSNENSPRVTSPMGSTGSLSPSGCSGIEVSSRPSSPNVMATGNTTPRLEHQGRWRSKGRLKIPKSLASKAKSLRAGLRGEKHAPRSGSSPMSSSPQPDSEGGLNSRPESACSSSSSRPPSALRTRPTESVVRAEVHVSFTVPDSGKESPRSDGTSSSSDIRSPRSLSTTSLQDTAEGDHMPDASS